MQNIRTKWHKLLSLFDQDEVYLTAPTNQQVGGDTTGKATHWDEFKPNKPAMRWLLTKLDELPKFVVDSDLLELVMREGYDRSLLDMQKANVLRLPFAAMIVEFDYGGAHFIIMLRDQLAGGHLPWENENRGAFEEKFKALPFYGLVFRICDDEEGPYAVLSPSIQGINFEERDGVPWIGITAQGLEIFPSDPAMDELVKQTWYKDGAGVFRAVATAVLVMHTRGVAREVVDCSKMNKKRIASNKPPIPHHVVLHIGKVYRSDGMGVGADYVPRKSPMPHWRKGHIRSVRYGPNREKIRDVYVEPMLVAFHNQQEEPKPKEYVVTK